jgi:hypothetical protein
MSGPTVLHTSRTDGIDLISLSDVRHTVVDFKTSMWSFHNCKMIFDAPYTVKTLDLHQPECYMYSVLKLTPGYYLCRVNSAPHAAGNCRLELLERDDSDGTATKIERRHGCLCTKKNDLKLLITHDSNTELRLTFDPMISTCVPSFHNMEVRMRQHIVMPFKTNIRSGMYTLPPMRYDSHDMHIVLKKVHYVIHWLSTLDKDVSELMTMLSDPLLDIEQQLTSCEYTQIVQQIQRSITECLPESFIATSFHFSVNLFPDLRFPLISATLIKELDQCISASSINPTKMVGILSHSSKYLNHMLCEYIEFKQKLSDKMIVCQKKGASTETWWNSIQIHV